MQRQAVLEAVRSTDCHPSAEWVYDEVKKVVPNISQATVYRNLKELSNLGLIATVETEDDRLHYDGNVCPHVHLVCTECGKIYDLKAPVELACLAKENGFILKRGKVVLYGVCSDCI